jgi:hypothetical protein
LVVVCLQQLDYVVVEHKHQGHDVVRGVFITRVSNVKDAMNETHNSNVLGQDVHWEARAAVDKAKEQG